MKSIKLPLEFIGEGQYVEGKCGIYAVVNPVGEIYVGQSINLQNRIRFHKKKGGVSTGKLLKSSMLRHGRKNHRYYLIKEMSENSTLKELWDWEKFYISKLSKEGFTLLNSNGGGSGGTKGGTGLGLSYRKLLFPLNYDKYDQ